MKKNESMTPTCNVSLLTTAFEMLSKYNMSLSQNQYIELIPKPFYFCVVEFQNKFPNLKIDLLFQNRDLGT